MKPGPCRTSIDFQHIDETALADEAYLHSKLRHVKRQGKELVAGDIQGNPGKSFKFNRNTGVWADYATGESGSGVIALEAAQKGITQSQAAKRVAQELGLSVTKPNYRDKKRDLPEAPTKPENRIATFDYTNEQGCVLFSVDRYEAPGCRKAIRQWHSGPDGRRINNLKGVHLVPFRLPDLLMADTIFIVEGEPKVLELTAWDLAATCNPMGANAWRKDYNLYFQGRHVIILPDNDPPGREHTRRIADSLLPVAASIKVLELPGLPPKGDIVDWKKAGHTREELLELAAKAPLIEKAPETDDSDHLPATEDGIASIFAQRFKGELLYCHDTGTWFKWDGMHWRVEKTRLAFSWARELCREVASVASNQKTSIILSKASTAAAVERFAQADRAFAVTSEIWDPDPYLLGTPGGAVDLQTGSVQAARREDHITRLTAIAPSVTSEAPLWRRFLDETTRGDRDLQRFLRQVAGYALTGDTSEHALFFIYGPGGNGKSVFLNTLTNILGDYAVTSAMYTFTVSNGDKHPTDLAMLRGARLVSVSETEEGRSWAESRIKALTGGDKIAARFMRQDFFEYRPQFKLIIVGNHKPVLRNVDDATRRRFNIIPFIHKPVSPDKTLEEKLKAEYPAILCWMIEGCLDWQATGLVRPETVRQATESYFDEQDMFGRWIEECCVRNPRAFDTTAHLFSSWYGYAERNGEQAGSSKAFSANLSKREFAADRMTVHGVTKRVFRGLVLKNEIERNADETGR